MIELGNINISEQPIIRNPDGTVSNLRSISIGDERGEILIPTVADNPPRIMSNREAIEEFRRTGRHLGIFRSPEAATAFAKSLSAEQARKF